MKMNTGTFSTSTVLQNNLTTNLLKYPEISKALIRQYPQYSLTYFTEGTGRFAKEELIGSNRFEWFIQGRLNSVSTCNGAANGAAVGVATGGATNAIFSIEFDTVYINLYDVIRTRSGVTAVCISTDYSGTHSAINGGTVLAFRVTDNGNAAITFADEFTDGYTVNTIGTAFPENSSQGYENHTFPDKYTNWLTIFRKRKSISGSALTDVTWVENNGQRLWYWTDLNYVLDEFLYQKELAFWYGNASKTASASAGVETFAATAVADASANEIVTGDGILAQVTGSHSANYAGILSENTLVKFLANLQLQAGNPNSDWVVFTGTGGMHAFHQAMKDYVSGSGASEPSKMYDMDAGREVEVGGNFRTYYALGHRLTLVHAPIFDDPNLHTKQSGPNFVDESYKMVFLDLGVSNGVSNVEVKTKGAGGVDRGMIVKHIPGMVDPFDPKSIKAASSSDAFTMECLSESGIIVRNPNACGVLSF